MGGKEGKGGYDPFVEKFLEVNPHLTRGGFTILKEVSVRLLLAPLTYARRLQEQHGIRGHIATVPIISAPFLVSIGTAALTGSFDQRAVTMGGATWLVECMVFDNFNPEPPRPSLNIPIVERQSHWRPYGRSQPVISSRTEQNRSRKKDPSNSLVSRVIEGERDNVRPILNGIPSLMIKQNFIEVATRLKEVERITFGKELTDEEREEKLLQVRDFRNSDKPTQNISDWADFWISLKRRI